MTINEAKELIALAHKNANDFEKFIKDSHQKEIDKFIHFVEEDLQNIITNGGYGYNHGCGNYLFINDPKSSESYQARKDILNHFINLGFSNAHWDKTHGGNFCLVVL